MRIKVTRGRFYATQDASVDQAFERYLNDRFHNHDERLVSFVETNAGYSSKDDPTTSLVWAEYLMVFNYDD